MPVAIFIYRCIYCRYLSPGECIIYDRGSEFCNNLAKILHDSFNVDVRVISAGHPQSNGQAEAMVGTIKDNMKAFMTEICNQVLCSFFGIKTLVYALGMKNTRLFPGNKKHQFVP